MVGTMPQSKRSIEEEGEQEGEHNHNLLEGITTARTLRGLGDAEEKIEREREREKAEEFDG
jgi:hypothetical protein